MIRYDRHCLHSDPQLESAEKTRTKRGTLPQEEVDVPGGQLVDVLQCLRGGQLERCLHDLTRRCKMYYCVQQKKDSTTRIRTVTRVYAQRFFLQNCRNALLVQMTDTCHAADVDETGSSCSGIQSSQLTHVGGPRTTSLFDNK